jgi:hypothetical protein
MTDARLCCCKAAILQRTNTEIGNKYFQNENCSATVPISTFMCLWAIYTFPRSTFLFFCRKYVDRLFLEICKSIKDTWMWKLGLRLRNFRKRNKLIGFSLQCKTANVQVIIWYLYMYMYMLPVYGRNNYSDAWCTSPCRGIFCHDIMISHLLNESSSGAM